MEIVKKNLVSIICGVVALLAFVAIFWPLGGYFSALQTQVDARKATNDTLTGLISKDRKLPIVDPVRIEQERLEQFPSKKAIEKGEEVTKQVADISNEMLKIAVDLNVHQPLLPDALPNPRDTAKFAFKDAYNRVMDDVIPNEILAAGMPPSRDEINNVATQKYEKEYKPLIQSFGSANNEAEVKAKFENDTRRLDRELQQKVAQSRKIYMAPDAMQKNLFGIAAADTDQIWWAQQALWVQLDVAHAIAATNASATNVTDAPVKNLVTLTIPMTYEGLSSSNAQMGEGGQAPAGPADGSAPLTKVFTNSPTGRVSNTLFDVMHFDLRVHVDAEQIPLFLAELSKNKLITVLNVQLGSVNAQEAESYGYFYGTKPVVQLDIQCEALFMRKWTEPLMPEKIKRLLGLLPAAGVPNQG